MTSFYAMFVHRYVEADLKHKCYCIKQICFLFQLQADIDKAVRAARSAFSIGSPWRIMHVAKRGELLHAFADLLKRDINHLAVCAIQLS